MADGNLGSLWFDLNIKDSNAAKAVKELAKALSDLDLKSEEGIKSAEKLFGMFNRGFSKELAEDFKNVAAQVAIQAQETEKLNSRMKELSELKADIFKRDKEASEHGNFIAMKNEAQVAQELSARLSELLKLKADIIARDKEMEAHGSFVAIINETRQAQELNARLREMQALKNDILARDRESALHGEFSQIKESLNEQAARNKELSDLKADIIARNEQLIADEKKLSEIAASRASFAQEEYRSRLNWDREKSSLFAKSLQKQMQDEADEEKANSDKVERILQEKQHAKEMAAKKESEIEEQRQEKMRQSAQIAQETASAEIDWNRKKGEAFAKALQQQMEKSAQEELRNQQIVESAIQARLHAKEMAAKKESEIEEQRQEKMRQSAQIAQEEANSEARWNEMKAKAFSDAIKKQMEEDVKAEKNRQVSFKSSGFDISVIERRLSELRRIKDIQEQLNFYNPKAQYAFAQLESMRKFGNANAPDIRHYEDDLQRIRNIIANLEAEFSKLGGSDIVKNIDGAIKGLEQTLTSLKNGGVVDLGKILGLENKSTDPFRIEKEAAMATEAHVKKQNELNASFEKFFRIQEQTEANEKRLKEAIDATNRARRESVSASRQQAESLVRDRIKELEAQRQQIQGLFGKGKEVLSTEELGRIQGAFSQITQELNTLRSTMGNLGSYSIKDLFAMSRGTSDFSPMINSMNAVVEKKREAIELERQHQQEIAKSAAKARNDLASAFAGANAEAKKMQSIVGDIKSLFLQGGIVFGAQQFFNSIVQTGGEIVQQHIALRSILGDVQKADELFNQTQQLALQSPFKFGELNRDVKQLAAFGVEANDLYDTTKRLADIASGLGVSFERLGLAYGQVKARSWLDGKELRQFAYAGLPLLQRITEMYNREGKNGKNNYTEADVKKMISARGVSFNDVQKVLWEMADEGGQFYNMQLVLSETLLGRWNKLIDAWDIMLGKFADGKGVIGGTFSFAINRVTDLILALDKLSPAVMSFGAIFAARKLTGFASSKLSVGSLKTDYASQLNTQLRSYAIEQQKLVTEGQIKQEIAAQNVQKRAYMLADADSLKASFSRLALEGKMSVLQMQRALKEGLIDEALVKELATMGMITAKQEQIILNGGRTAAVFNMAGTKLSGLFNMLGGWWGIAITAISSLVMAVSQYSSKIEQETKTMTDSARQNAKRIDDFLASVGAKPTDREGLKKDIDGMKDLLEQSNLYTDTIKEQVERSGDLANQYDILKEKVIEARNATRFDEKFADTAVNAVARSGQSMLVGETINESGLGKGWLADTLGVLSGLFNDDLEKNANQLSESLNRVSLSLSTAFDENQRKKIEAVANSMLPVADRTKSLEEKISILRDKGGNDWDSFVNQVASGDKDIEKHLEDIGDSSKDMMSDLNEIAEDDVPKMIAYLQQSLHLYGKDFEDWCKRNPHKYAQMWDDMLAVAKVKAPAIADIIKRLAMSAVGIVSTDDRKGGGKKTYNSGIDTDFASVIRDRLFKNGTITGKKKKGKFWVSEVDSYLRQVQDDSWQKTGENVQTKLKAARNELDMLDTGKADKNSRHYKVALHEYSIWKAIADAGYISDDLGKNKTTGNFGKSGKNGRQEDSELKALQERLSSLKSARQMYQKYSSIMSDEEAADKTYKLFPEVKDLDLKDYQVAVRKLLDGFKINTTDRKKFQTSVDREVAEWFFSEKDKKEFDKKAADFTEYIDRLSGQWDLYKSLLEKTGDKNFSKSAFLNNFIIDDKAEELIMEYNRSFGKDFRRSNLMYLTDGEAKDKLTKAGEYDAWKKIVVLLRGNYTDSLNKTADIIKESLDYEEQIVAVREKYNKLIEDANKVGNNRAAVAARQQMEKEIGKINLDKFKNSSDYLNFYGAIVSLGRTKAQDIARRIRENINDALQSGAIDAREYAKELKQLEEQLNKLSEIQPSFLHGGLNGIVSSKNNRGSGMFTQGSSMYDEAQEMFKVFQQKGDLGGMAQTSQAKVAGQSMMKGGQQLMEGASKMQGSIAIIDAIIHGINDIVQGLNDTFNDLKDTAEALGHDTTTDGWTDASSFFSGFSSASASATKGWDSLKNGDIGGVISGVTGSFTGWIKAFSAGHDAKLDRQIKLAERQITELKNISSNINSVIEKTLGGIYSYQRSDATASKLSSIKSDYQSYDALAKSSFGKKILGGVNLSDYSSDTYKAVLDTDKNYSAYADQFALINAQKDELKKQRDAEADKKKKDQDKIADYDQQITEMELQIKTFAQDFLKDIYSIDMKSWASELTDAVVGAWEKGEDAVDAYKEKVKDMVKDVTKNIVTQKIMEKALQKPLDYLTGILDSKGKLDETDMNQLADMLYKVGDETIPQITGIFDALKNRGLDLRENGSSSATNSIKSITEETGDLLASYINEIRLDVSVDRENIKLIADAVTGLPELNVIARSQLTAMNQLVTLAEYRNSKLDDMYSWMRAVTSGTGTKSISMK